MESGTLPKIYLLEDDIFFNRMLKHALWHSEFVNVQTFTSTEDFMKELHFEVPDLLIVGYRPEDTPKNSLLQKITKCNPEIPLVILSAPEETEIRLGTLRNGVTKCIKKDKLAIPKLKVIARQIKLSKSKSRATAFS